MKKLFLASSFADVSNLFPHFVKEECRGKTVTFIPTASIPQKVKFYVETAKKAFKKLGLIVDLLDVSTATPEEISNKLLQNDYIYISGGSTFFLLQELKRSGADKIIIDQINRGKIYIGESAGSIIMSPNIEYIHIMDDKAKAENLNNYQGLEVVNFYPIPHYTNLPHKEAAEKIIAKYETVLTLYPISNSQAILVNGDDVEVV